MVCDWVLWINKTDINKNVPDSNMIFSREIILHKKEKKNNDHIIIRSWSAVPKMQTARGRKDMFVAAVYSLRSGTMSVYALEAVINAAT